MKNIIVLVHSCYDEMSIEIKNPIILSLDPEIASYLPRTRVNIILKIEITSAHNYL